MNKECSISVIEHIYLSLGNVKSEAMAFCKCQFLAYAIIE